MLNFFKRRNAGVDVGEAPDLAEVVEGYSIEVMPRTAAKVEDFKALLPQGTRVYVAHIEGTRSRTWSRRQSGCARMGSL